MFKIEMIESFIWDVSDAGVPMLKKFMNDYNIDPIVMGKGRKS
jgi:hypothetical protein